MPMINTVKTFVDGLGITPYAFGKDAGIAQKTAYDLYRFPDHLPSPKVLARICDTYEVQPNSILKWVKRDRKS